MGLPKGFHGNESLLSIVDTIAKRSNVYIETGTNVGHTFHYVSRTYPQINCYGCEPVKPYFEKVFFRTHTLANATVYNQTSQLFMQTLNKKHKDIFQKPFFAWIDAHSKNFQWPLAEEMKFFTTRAKNAYLLIDDFFVPNQPQFRSNKFGAQRYTIEYISQFFDPSVKLSIYFPTYKRAKEDRTLTGWVMLTTDPNCQGLLAPHQRIISKYQ